jgi:hypothetical protein
MPQFNFSASVGAGLTAFPLATWQFRFPPKKSLLELLVNGSAAGLVMNLTTGAESIVQSESPISGGGTAGTLPARLNTEPIVDAVDPGEEIVLSVRNPTGGAITVNVVAILTYSQATA